MQLIGLARLGNSPEIRYTPNGDPVMDLSLAFNYGKKGADGKVPTQWVSATMWGARVEKLHPYLVKGQQLFVTLGDPHLEEYKRKDGTGGTTLRARLNELEFAGPKPEQEERPRPAANHAGGSFDDLEDDVPF
jgi:single-strand DNA-binding protein